MKHSPDHTSISDAVAAILADVDAQIAARNPTCTASGRCCRFEEYGHRLYLTAAELLHFQTVHAPPPNLQSPISNRKSVSLPQFFAQSSPTGCPYQIEGLCTAREARPLGCRIYFCDETAQTWQEQVYEYAHAKLKALHETHHLPYRYLEWRAALREIMQSDSPAGD